jgi:hypothetical protein|tara:strand:- start:1503 stop:1859 length:357 start_codon:yes stop_codon:yes gene_type:complete
MERRSIIIVLVILIIPGVLVARDWDDIKLRLTRIWGLGTIENNPLLPSLDKDLKSVEKNNSRIDLDDLLSGGPPKDGIPSVDDPKFESAKDSPFEDDELILGVVINDEAKAYPYGILN